jgi:hypothetical protein
VIFLATIPLFYSLEIEGGKDRGMRVKMKVLLEGGENGLGELYCVGFLMSDIRFLALKPSVSKV